MKGIFYVLSLYVLLSCSASKEVNSTKQEEGKIVQKECYICEGDSIYINYSGIGYNPYFQYMNIMNCLNKTGRYGDEIANQEIAKIIKKAGYMGLYVFNGQFSLGALRGEAIFEAFLNLGIDDTPRTDMDGNPGLRTRTNMNFRQLERMIESIEGMKDIRAYITKENPLDGENFKQYANAKTLFYIDRIMYNTIKQAWEEGKIVLKPYYKKPE